MIDPTMSSSLDEQPISIHDNDPPRKRRRKYIAKAWYAPPFSEVNDRQTLTGQQ